MSHAILACTTKPGQICQFGKFERATVGSSSSCELQIADLRLPPCQFRLVNLGRFCSLKLFEDACSTMVNGVVFDAGRVNDGSVIELRGYVFTLNFVAAPRGDCHRCPGEVGHSAGVEALQENLKEPDFDPAASMKGTVRGQVYRDVLNPIRSQSVQPYTSR